MSRIRRELRRQHISSDIEVRTVDGFQGREKEVTSSPGCLSYPPIYTIPILPPHLHDAYPTLQVILLSAVRANRYNGIGFLSDERRLNVALTRAKRALLIVGCRTTLAHDPSWAALLNHCEASACVLSAVDLAACGVHLEESAHQGEHPGMAQRLLAMEGTSDNDPPFALEPTDATTCTGA